MERLAKVLENSKTVETLACRLVFPQHFSFSQTSTHVSITRQKHGTRFLFLKSLNYGELDYHVYLFSENKSTINLYVFILN